MMLVGVVVGHLELFSGFTLQVAELMLDGSRVGSIVADFTCYTRSLQHSLLGMSPHLRSGLDDVVARWCELAY
ncbi:hypothetical protein Dimus_018412, partial [Dionaea muscipula]